MAVTDTSYLDAARLRRAQGWTQPNQAAPTGVAETNPLETILAEADQEYETRARDLEAQRVEMQNRELREDEELAAAAVPTAPAQAAPAAPRAPAPREQAPAEGEAAQAASPQEQATEAARMHGAQRRLAASQEGEGTVYDTSGGGRAPQQVERALTSVSDNLSHGAYERPVDREYWRQRRAEQRELHGPGGVDPMAFASAGVRAKLRAAARPTPPIPTGPGELPPWRRNAPTPVPGLPPGLGDPPPSSRRGARPARPPGPGEPTGLDDPPRRRAAVVAERNRNRRPRRPLPSSPEDQAMDREAAHLKADEGAERVRERQRVYRDRMHVIEEARLKAKERAERERRLGSQRGGPTPLRPE